MKVKKSDKDKKKWLDQCPEAIVILVGWDVVSSKKGKDHQAYA